jgi:O-antigen/teichoic acid export membrane protein
VSADSLPPVGVEATAVLSTRDERTAASSNLRRASMVSVVTTGSSHLLRLASNLILTRLLFEEAFGIMALVGVFLQGLQLFSDIGLRPAIIQNPKGEEPEFLATAFTIQSVRGVFLAAVAALGAAPFAAFYAKPELAAILPIAGLNAIIAGLGSTKTIALERKLVLGRIAILDVTSQLLGLVATSAWALHTPSVWALVFGSAVTGTAKTVLSHVALPGRRDRFGWNADFGREILNFGRWISLSTSLSFLANQSDRLILGKLLTTAQLGVYNIALLGATMPSLALSSISNSVLFPALSRAFEQGKDPSAECRRLRRPILLLGGYLTSGIAGGATIVVTLLYDDRYLAAGEMLRILGVGGWFSVVEVSAMYALMACGGSGWMAWSSAAKLVGTSVMMPVGYALGGVHGALVGFVLADIAKYAFIITGLRRRGVDVLSQDVRLTMLWTVAAAAALATTIATEPMGDAVPSLLLRAALVALAVTLVWAPTAEGYRRDARRARQEP